MVEPISKDLPSKPRLRWTLFSPGCFYVTIKARLSCSRCCT